MNRRRVVLAAVVTVVLALGALLAWQALAARSALEEARASVGEARAAASTGDLDGAEAAVTDARTSVERAEARTTGPHWWVAARVPLLGRAPRILVDVVEASSAAVEVLEATVEVAGPMLGDGLAIDAVGGELDLSILTEVEQVLGGLDLSRLRTETEELRATPASWIPDVVRDGRRDALAQADEAIATIDRARLGVRTLGRLLGSEGPVRFFLALQNPAELRGTGGLIGYWVELEIDGGRFTLSDPIRYTVLNRDEQGDLSFVETSDEFVARYGFAQAPGFFANVNVDPDLPTTGQVMLDLFRDRTGSDADGVMLLDPVAMGRLLRAIGPVTVPEDIRGDGSVIPARVGPDELPQVTLIDAYDVYGGGSGDRREFLSVFADALVTQVFSSTWDGVVLARQGAVAAGERNLQVFVEDDELQADLEELGVAGVMRARDGGDLLAATANNAAGNKQDVHVAHRFTGEIELAEEDGEWRRSASLSPMVENPLGQSGHDIYIIGAHEPSAMMSEDPDAIWGSELGLNRTWWTVWGPETASLARAVDADGESISVRTGAIHGHRAWDHWLETRYESSNHFTLAFDGPVEVVEEGPERVYRLTLWRQAKAIPDHWDLKISGPEGWSIASAAAEGGGAGKGMGVGGDGDPVTVSVVGDVVRVSGAATQDVHVEVRFTRSLWQRVKGFLSRPLF